MNVTDRQALKRWDIYRKSILDSTPVNVLETYADKVKRIADLEADPQRWKEYYFPKYMSSPSPAFHLKASRRMIRKFQQLKHWYEVRHWARGLAKDTLTMMDILYLVLTGKLRNIFMVSSTYDAAENFLTKYQCQLDSNQRLIDDYGKQEQPGSWTMGEFTTLKGVKFKALGAGQSPRGDSNEEVRPDCIIVNDFDTDEECLNEDIINKKWRWYENALFFTVDVANPYLVIWLGNIIAEDCCVARAGKMADYCEIINIRNDHGLSVWPEKNSEEDIDYLLSKVSYEAGQQEMFNNPMRTGKAFPEMTYGKCPPIKDSPFVVIYADPGTSNKDRPSVRSKAMNSCKAVVVLTFKESRRFVHKCFVDHVNNDTFIEWIFTASEYAKGAKAVFRYIENNTLQDPFYEQVLKPMVIAKNKAKGASVSLLPDTRKKGDKYTRIEATLEPLNRNGLLILNTDEKDDPHMKRLEAQFKSASPNSKTLDGPDAVEGGAFIINSKAASLVGKMDVLKMKKSTKRI